jgi:hypothetical protein
MAFTEDLSVFLSSADFAVPVTGWVHYRARRIGHAKRDYR